MLGHREKKSRGMWNWRGINILINIMNIYISNYGNFRIKFKTHACLILETVMVVERKEVDSKKYCQLIFNKSARHRVFNKCCSKKKKKTLIFKKTPNQNKTLNLYLMLSKIWLKIDNRYKHMQSKCENIKLPEENTGVNLCNLG